MPLSDDQRRAVAARMREIMRDHPDAWLDRVVMQAVLDVLGEGMRIGDTLADLIDRPTCNVTSRPGNDENDVCDSCSVCDFGWHKSRFDPPYRHCPNCGAKVVSGR